MDVGSVLCGKLNAWGCVSMSTAKKNCIYCGRLFLPDPRVGKRQKRCFRDECRRAQNCKKSRKWIKRHPDYQDGRKAKLRDWADAYPNYWRNYRKTHPDYTAKDNRRRALALRRQRCSAKLTSIRSIAVEKLRQIQNEEPQNCSAKLTQTDRRINGIMDYLIWTVDQPCSAKHYTYRQNHIFGT